MCHHPKNQVNVSRKRCLCALESSKFFEAPCIKNQKSSFIFMIKSELKFEKCLNRFPVKCGSRNENYAPINRARGPYEEIFVLTFKTYGPNFECQNKYFLYGPKSRLIRVLLYTYPNKTV